jgi:sarcosine oxidase gamma subunit
MQDAPDDPMSPLLMEAMKRLLCWDGKWPIIWVIGDIWVAHLGPDEWTIGPDEPATTAQVRELLIRANGAYELQDY